MGEEWDGIDRRSIEERLRHLEREMAAYVVLLQRHTDVLAKIEKKLEAPARIPEWIAASVTSLALFGGILYAAFIAPLDTRLAHIDNKIDMMDKRITTNKKLFIEVLREHKAASVDAKPAEPIN